MDDTTVALRLLVDRRDQLGRTRTEIVSRLHHLLLELIPGGAKNDLSELVASTGSRLQDLHGIGPSGAARLIGDIGDVTRPANADHPVQITYARCARTV